MSVTAAASTSFYKKIDLPLAKIIPLLNRQIHEIFKSNCNDFQDALFSQNLLREFSGNIYEAFSKDYSSVSI